MPRGVEFRVPLADVLEAAERHREGWSLRSIARLHWRRWGYASPQSALEGLRGALKLLDEPVRDRVEASRLASTMHGKATRAARNPGHPLHQAFLEHRKATRQRQGRCEGVRVTYPGKGSPCRNLAVDGSRFCHHHQNQD